MAMHNPWHAKTEEMNLGALGAGGIHGLPMDSVMNGGVLMPVLKMQGMLEVA